MTQVTPPPPPAPPRAKGGTTRLLVILTLVAMMMFVASLGVLWWAVSASGKGDVTKGSFLHVELSGPLAEDPAPPSLFDDPERADPTVDEIAAAIRLAADDERIDGLYLELAGTSGGWGSFQELRAAVESFREADKPCVAYAPSALGNGSYYLASACDTIGMAPAGINMVWGLQMELTYYAGTLDMIGAEAQMLHVGDFKSAVEPFERTGPSDAAAQPYESILTSLFDRMVADIADGRGLDPDVVRDLIDAPPLAPAQALERGVVDVLAWPDAMRARVHLVGEDDWVERLDEPLVQDDDDDDEHLTDLDEVVKEVRADRGRRGPKIALVHAVGSIVQGGVEPSLFGDDGNLTDGEYSRWMKKVRDNDDIKAVVVRVDSPGGDGLASAIMWRENARTQAAGKPIVVSMANYAASGGYFLSANADWIVAEPSTLTGSIGVFGGKLDLGGTWEKLGMNTHRFQRGSMADIFSSSKGFDADERVAFQGYLDGFYDDFLDIVAAGRDMDRDAVHAVAQGRVWTGEQALEHGLVDEIGTLAAAIDKARELADEPDAAVRIVPKRKSLWEMITEDMGDATASPDAAALLPMDDAVRHELGVLDRIGRGGGVAAWWPGAPEVR